MIACEVCGTQKKLKTKTRNNQHKMILCGRHYAQMSNHGHIMLRTIYDKNEFIYYDTYAEMLLYDIDCNESGRTIIDLEDVEHIKQYKWLQDSSHGYIIHCHDKLYLHRFLMQIHNHNIEGMDIDHIDRNRLNNRKNNLRVTTHMKNSYNISKPSNNKTGIIGVFWDSNRFKWRVEIKANKVRYNLGRYDDFQDAIKIRLTNELKYFGEFAPQRHLFEEYNIH